MATQRRHTAQQAAVANALRQLDAFISAQELHRRLASTGSGIGVATVYRSLNRLVAEGLAEVDTDSSGQQLFRRRETSGHHHHLICRNCGAAEDLVAPEIESWAERIAQQHGYTQVDHQLTVVGLCPKCTTRFRAEAKDAPGPEPQADLRPNA